MAKLPVGELLTDMVVYLDSFLILTTTAGVRVCNIDSDGSVTIGPLSHESNTYTGIFCLDRFAYCSYVGEGDEGDVRVRRFDLSMPIASDGSLANAADLSFAGSDPPKWIGYMPTGYLSEVDDVLTTSPRLVWHDGSSNFYIQGSGVADTSWLKTSRIRFDTSIPKLWTGGIIIGDPEADVTVEVEGSDGNSYACTYDTTENTFAVSTSPTLTWV